MLRVCAEPTYRPKAANGVRATLGDGHGSSDSWSEAGPSRSRSVRAMLLWSERLSVQVGVNIRALEPDISRLPATTDYEDAPEIPKFSRNLWGPRHTGKAGALTELDSAPVKPRWTNRNPCLSPPG